MRTSTAAPSIRSLAVHMSGTCRPTSSPLSVRFGTISVRHQAPLPIGLLPEERFRRIVRRLALFRHATALGCAERGLQLHGIEVLGVARRARLLTP
jgi:hypothetical protein